MTARPIPSIHQSWRLRYLANWRKAVKVLPEMRTEYKRDKEWNLWMTSIIFHPIALLICAAASAWYAFKIKGDK